MEGRIGRRDSFGGVRWEEACDGGEEGRMHAAQQAAALCAMGMQLVDHRSSYVPRLPRCCCFLPLEMQMDCFLPEKSAGVARTREERAPDMDAQHTSSA
jgi:hypothetical protein